MLNHACTILEQDFREVLFSKLRQGFPSGFDLTQAYNYVQSTLTQGRIQSTDGETDKSRAAFLVSFAIINVNYHILLSYVLTARSVTIIQLIYNNDNNNNNNNTFVERHNAVASKALTLTHAQ